MAKTDATEQDVLKMLVMGVDPSYRAQTNRYIALHTASLTDNSTASTNEANYTNYARVAVPTSAWQINANGDLENTQAITFPTAGIGANQTVVAFSITTAASGNSQVLYYGDLDVPLQVTQGIAVTFPPGGLKIREN